jgi:hypothetical protein
MEFQFDEEYLNGFQVQQQYGVFFMRKIMVPCVNHSR